MAVPEGFVPDGFEPDTGFAPAARDALPPAGQPQRGTQWTPPNYAARALNTLPALGAMGGMAGGGALGALMGGVGAPIGAGLGAGAGSVLGQWGRYALAPMVGLDAPMPSLAQPMETALDVGAGMTGVGLAGVARGVAPGAMRTGLRMPPTWREQWKGSVAGGELPEQAALRMGVGTRAGAAKVASTAGRAEHGAIVAAKKAGHKITPEQLAARALKQAEEVAGRVLTKQERAKIVQRTATIADELLNTAAMGVKVRNLRPRIKASALGFDPTQGLTIKQAAQKLSSAKHAQQAQGLASKAVPDELKMIGESAREALAGMPGVAKPTAEAQKAILLRRALGRAEAVQQWTLPQMTAGLGGLATGALAGGGGAIPAALGGVVAHQLASPEAQRRLALALWNPGLQGGLQYAPLSLDALYRAATARGMAPPDTLGNPPWGTDDPNNP